MRTVNFTSSIRSFTHPSVRKRNVISCHAFYGNDDPYKRSDDVIYTDQYWSTVKRLDKSWYVSSSKIIPDGKYLSDMIERKWGRKYKCEFSQDKRGYITFVVLPFIVIDNDEEYYQQMDEMVNVLNKYGATQKVYDEITYHINTKGPSKPDWVLRERNIVINTGVSVEGARNSEWNL